VHLSNILARSEPLRRQSLIGAQVIGLIAGFGVLGYALGVQALLEHLASRASLPQRP
jgi:3-dehydroquinate dehydratase-2